MRNGGLALDLVPWYDSFIGGRTMYPVMNLGQDAQTPVANPTQRPAPEAGVCCQAVADGSVVCSNGIVYLPGCPKAPEPNVQGMAQVQNGIPIPPPATACTGTQAPATTPTPAAAAPSSPSLVLPIVGAALGGAALATGAYFLFFK